MIMNKKTRMQRISEEIAKCKECKRNKFGLPVPGEGNLDAKIMFLGEAPGYKESETGRPFVGRAGKFLDKMLVKSEIKRESVFITSPVKYFPGKRAPDLDEIRHGMVHTLKQIETINPKIIVLLGGTAVKALLDEKSKVCDIHGKVVEKDGIKYFPTIHPSAAMRFTGMRLLMEKDFKRLKTIIG
jgi:uracil-DNA glycosylase family 4